MTWKLLWAICDMLLAALAVVIYAATLLVASTGVPGLVLTMFLPVIAQAYWIWAGWTATGVLFSPLALLCAGWLILLGIRIVAKRMSTPRPAWS